jgi:multimeric flavodoxin WrbA
VLGGYLIKKFKKQNFETESVNLQGALNDKQQRHLCLAVDRADTVLLASPLYFDSLPFLVTKAFEVIASHRKNVTNGRPKIFLAVINNGLPESYQNTVAFAICRNFALESGMLWAGGLAMGTGEGLISGKSPAGLKGFGSFKRPPLFYVLKALKMTASAVAKGYPVPEQAVQLIAKRPVPFISWDSWRTYVIKTSKRLLEEEAVKNGLRVEEMFKRPYKKNK